MPSRAADTCIRARWSPSRNGRPPYTRTVSNAARPRSTASSSARQNWFVHRHDPAPRQPRPRSQRHARTRTGSTNGAPDQLEQRPRLDERLLDLRLRVGVPDRSRRRPKVVDAPLGDRECPDRQREVEVAVRVEPARARPSRRRGRPVRARQCDRALRSSARRSPSRPGRRRPISSENPIPSRSVALNRGDEVDDARERSLGHQLRPVARCPGTQTPRERSFRSRSTIIVFSAASFSEARRSRPSRAGVCP